MRITETQLRILDGLQCERLSSNTDNFTLIDDFYNKRNNSLVETLQGDAFEDDENNRIAYYLVKNKEGNILFFFSLKCGLLYDEFIEGERFNLNYSQTQKKENVFLHNSRKSIIFEVSKYQNNTNVLYVQRYNKKIKQPNRNVYF